MDPPRREPDALALLGGTLLLLALPFAGFIAYIARSQTHPRAVYPVFGFAILMLLGLAVLGVVPFARVARDRALLRRWRGTPAPCLGCGLPRAASGACAHCAHPVDDTTRWWRTPAMDAPERLAASLFGAAIVTFALFPPLFAATRPGALAPLLWLLGAACAAFGAWLIRASLQGARASLARPLTMRYARSWTRRELPWFTEVRATLYDGRWQVEGRGGGGDDEPAPTRRTDDPFARGLARMLARWHRDGHAPLSWSTQIDWCWRPDAARATRAAPYREDGDAPPTQRAERGVWRVSFNASSFTALLDAERLPATTAAPDDEDAWELAEADWDVDLSKVIRALQRDEAVREALAARGQSPEPDDEDFLRALHAVCASRPPAA